MCMSQAYMKLPLFISSTPMFCCGMVEEGKKNKTYIYFSGVVTQMLLLSNRTNLECFS